MNASDKIIIFSLAWTSRHCDLFVLISPLITLSLHLGSRVVTRRREKIIFAKSQPPCDIHRQYLDVFLIHRLEFRCFAVEFLTALLISLKPSSIIIVFYLKKPLAHDFLPFRVIWKQACRLDFQKSCFYGQTSIGRWIFCTVMIYFFPWFLLLSIFRKLLKESDHFVEKIQHESTAVNIESL